MIDVKTKIHDRRSLEFKIGFSTSDSSPAGEFLIGMWIFVPESLDINSSTYSKNDFYRDLKSNVRLITPAFPLAQLASPSGVPLSNVLNSAPERLEHQIKMFSAIVKSSVRDAAAEVCEGKMDCGQFISGVRGVIKAYDLMPQCEGRDLCREFAYTTVIHHSFKVLEKFPDNAQIASLIKELNSGREHLGYQTVNAQKPDSSYLYRQGILKKYVEHHLYLRAHKKKDAVLVEQAYYSIAAGLAMIFATLIAWIFQRTFGNLTWPLFIALIISYMMKDRIKELMRYYFAHKVRSRYFDNKADICWNDRKVGSLKEAFDFIDPRRLSSQVRECRDGGRRYGPSVRAASEEVMLYRKKVKIDGDLSAGHTYEYNGVNDIIRLHVGSFMRMMDNEASKVETIDADGKITTVDSPRDYHINIVLQCEQNGSTEYQHFRIYLNSTGIQQVEKII